MTRKHFTALAKEISLILDSHAREEAARAVARVCMDFNPNFDRERFMAACGL